MRAAIVVLAAALAGCGTMSGLNGGAEFACQAPEGVICTSVSGVYANSIAGALPAQRDPEAARAKPRKGNDIEARSQAAVKRAYQPQAAATAGPMAAGEPLLSAPRVFRLWIAPHTDDEGDLHGDSYVYVMWHRGEWLLPHTQAQVRAKYAPVSAPARRGQPVRPERPQEPSREKIDSARQVTEERGDDR